MMPWRWCVRNPALCTDTVYEPGIRNGTVYAPAAVVVVLTTVFVFSFVMVTSQFAMTPPLESLTRPRIVPRNSCADNSKQTSTIHPKMAQTPRIRHSFGNGVSECAARV